MKFPSREQVESVKNQYPAGTRVELVQMEDPQAPPIGTKGTVTGVDDTGSIMVNWDNGSGLNVIYGEDVVRKICPLCGGPLTRHPALSRKDNKTLISRPSAWTSKIRRESSLQCTSFPIKRTRNKYFKYVQK